jgi:hypothetical protein
MLAFTESNVRGVWQGDLFPDFSVIRHSAVLVRSLGPSKPNAPILNVLEVNVHLFPCSQISINSFKQSYGAMLSGSLTKATKSMAG